MRAKNNNTQFIYVHYTITDNILYIQNKPDAYISMISNSQTCLLTPNDCCATCAAIKIPLQQEHYSYQPNAMPPADHCAWRHSEALKPWMCAPGRQVWWVYAPQIRDETLLHIAAAHSAAQTLGHSYASLTKWVAQSEKIVDPQI